MGNTKDIQGTTLQERNEENPALEGSFEASQTNAHTQVAQTAVCSIRSRQVRQTGNEKVCAEVLALRV